MGSFSIWHWLIVLLVVAMVFGTKKLGSIGSDLGRAVKGFKDGLNASGTHEPTGSVATADGKPAESLPAPRTPTHPITIDAETHVKSSHD